jgi:hypothetical protein
LEAWRLSIRSDVEVTIAKFGSRWSDDEFIMALALYKTPGVRPYRKDLKVIELGQITGRTASSIALRLANYRAIDTGNRSGMTHYPLGVRKVWQEFEGRDEVLMSEASRLKRKFLGAITGL